MNTPELFPGEASLRETATQAVGLLAREGVVCWVGDLMPEELTVET